MPGRRDLLNEQYRSMKGDETNALDRPWYRYLLPFATTRTQVVCRMIGERKFHSVVELGCGNAAIAVQKLANFARYTGLEISDYQISLISEEIRSHSKVQIRQHDLNRPLPLSPAACDLVISLSVIEYIEDPYSFLREINRVLKPDGALIIHTMNLAFFPRRLQLLFGKLPTFNAAPGWQGGILHHFTYPTMKKLLRETGFQVLEARCAGLAPAFRMWLPNLLASDMIFLCQKIKDASLR